MNQSTAQRLQTPAESGSAESRRAEQDRRRADEPQPLAATARAAGHELNNLLTTILGRSQYLLCQLAEGDVERAEVCRHLRQIEGAARNGARSVERLMHAAHARGSARSVADEPRKMGILVIDDEPPVRRLLGEILRSAGHEVFETSSPRQGLEMLERESIDLLLTDLGMPGMSGWDVARCARERYPELQIGVISGWGEHATTRELADQGVDFLWAKPFEVKEILAALKEL